VGECGVKKFGGQIGVLDLDEVVRRGGVNLKASVPLEMRKEKKKKKKKNSLLKDKH